MASFPRVRRAIDLHAHTLASDGTLAPAELVALAAQQGLVALAVTDHDQLGGLPEAREAGARRGVEIITGVELSVTHPAGEFHLLGYLFDEGNAALSTRLAGLREGRARRAEQMVARLNTLGVSITMADVVEAAQGRTEALGRPHVARALMARGVVGSIAEAFDRYLAEGRPAHVGKDKLGAQEALALLHGAGGVAVLAHPVTVREDAQESLVRELAALGLDGIEVMHSKHGEAERARFGALADELDLVAAGGSDFHGANKPDVALGSGREGNVRVDYATLDALRKRAERWRRA